jgi:hypothetical protein
MQKIYVRDFEKELRYKMAVHIYSKFIDAEFVQLMAKSGCNKIV